MQVASKSATIVNLDAWVMKDMTDVVTAQVCEPDPSSLPEALRKEPSDAVMAIEELKDFALDVYPNPSSDIIRLKYNGITHYRHLTLTLHSASGTVIHQEKFSTYETLPQISGLKPGIYFLQIESANKRKVYKIIMSQ
jgi:hypothetical protein